MNKTQQKRFDRFYLAYPKKASKGDAEKAFKTLDPDDDLTTKMTLALQAQFRHRQVMKKNNEWLPELKAAGPWIRQKCWLDEIPSHAATQEKRQPLKNCDECGDEIHGPAYTKCTFHQSRFNSERSGDTEKLRVKFKELNLGNLSRTELVARCRKLCGKLGLNL